MSDVLYFIALILVVGWLIGFFILSFSGLVHILLVLAVISVLLRLIKGRKV